MKQSFVERELEDVSEAIDVLDALDLPAEHIPSYQNTPWSALNQLLGKVDRITGGRAGLFQRLFSFVFIGGFGALVNLAVMTICLVIPMPLEYQIHWLIAFLVASEISVLANFIPNDYFTFRSMAGQRSWLARCVRFHITASSGILLTFVISYALTHFLRTPAFVSQAVALVLVMFFNFSAHHFFTYRGTKTAVNE
jgi:putative flippase GtrA